MIQAVAIGPALGFALASQTIVMMPVFLLGSLSPLIMPEMGIDAFGIGLGVAAFYAASAAGSALAAPLADRANSWWIAQICMFTVAAAGAIIALLGHNAWWITFVCLVVAGVTNGVIQPATNVMVSRFVPNGMQGAAFGLKQASIPLATMLGGLAVPAIGITLGWQWAFGLAGIIALGLGLSMPQGTRTATRSAREQAAVILPRSTLLLLAVMSGLGAASANSMAGFLAPSIVASGHSPEAAGMILAAGSILSISIRIASGLAADRFVLPLLSIVTVMFVGGAAAYALLAVADTVLLIAIGALMAFGLGWGWSGLSILAIVRSSSGSAGSATGITQAGVFTGAVLGPVCFGWLAANHSYAAAWKLMGLFALLAAACAAICHRRVVYPGTAELER